MFFNLVAEVMRGIIYLALHVTNAGAFPKALSLKEETELIEQMANGSEKAKNKLIEHNLRLVAHIVKKYYSGQVEQDDLIGKGAQGGEIVGGQEDGQVIFGAQLVQHVQQLVLALDVHAGQGFVQNEDVGHRLQRQGQQHPLQLTAG